MEEELTEYLRQADCLAVYGSVPDDKVREIATELANRAFLLATEIAPDVIEDVLGPVPDPCECPNCDDPTNGGECMRNFCSVCRDELGHDATWPERCDDCGGGWVIEELPVNGGR